MTNDANGMQLKSENKLLINQIFVLLLSSIVVVEVGIFSAEGKSCYVRDSRFKLQELFFYLHWVTDVSDSSSLGSLLENENVNVYGCIVPAYETNWNATQVSWSGE